MKSVLDQIYAYHGRQRPEYTPREILCFLSGMNHASRIAQSTQKGYIAANAINQEARTLSLFAEQKGVM